MKNIVIITAGGSGTRISNEKKKQFIQIMDRPLLFWTIDKFVDHPQIDGVIITLPQDEIAVYKDLIKKEYNDLPIKIIAGGNQRQDSVYNALIYCSNSTELVLIHDGVRPFISQTDISNLIKKAQQKKAVIPVSKVKNTIKKIKQDKILQTVPREDLVNAYTPQVFQFKLLKQCHDDANNKSLYCTDDAALLEHFGYPVYTLECSSHNFKITDPFDLEIAKLILENNLNRR
ncbi:MAG: 2-C-methyl-D-erythritol 4-phosphate cytidylyltransferase [Candidatus Cloacimonetes bacterium]|jgi:2-C-methyl-D-erythritol 4-phosphate cytidylyltransferase|nr:2-C-methyl-D-erythritol 4-phosphate cytidylyltransferase [Candidatus Cloacimonadota bacterium]